MKYHRRWGISRSSSEWDRVHPPRHNHQVNETVKFVYEVSEFLAYVIKRL